MKRNFALALCIACGCSGAAFADDITIDPHPFVATASRAQVQEELRQFRMAGINPWADDYNPLAQARGTMTRGEVTAGFLADRKMVAAFSAEDSGSSYLKIASRRAPATEIAVEAGTQLASE